MACILYRWMHIDCRQLRGPDGSKLPGVPLAELSYRLFWVYRHDVYRIMMSLQNVIDGWDWLPQEQAAVEGLQDLVRHITGATTKNRAFTLHTQCQR